MVFTSSTNQTFDVITDMFVYERDTNNALRDQIYTLREKLRASDTALVQERLNVDKLRSDIRNVLGQLSPHAIQVDDILDTAASRVLFRRAHVRAVVEQALDTYYGHLERIVASLYVQLTDVSSRRASKLQLAEVSSRRASKLILKH